MQEIEAKGVNTFMYKLHYEGILEYEKLDSLLDNCNKVFDFYYSNGKTSNYIEIARGIVLMFEHFFIFALLSKRQKRCFIR